jgi:hypothetical protein
MLEEDLKLLYDLAWAKADNIERRYLCEGAQLPYDAQPFEVFTAIAKNSPHIDPRLSTYLWDELNVKLTTHAVTYNNMPLSDGIANALQLALAYELGQRIDRVLAELGPDYDNILQAEVEAAARKAGIPHPVISYALGRKQSGE